MRQPAWILVALLALAPSCESTNDKDVTDTVVPDTPNDTGGEDVTPFDPGPKEDVPLADPLADVVQPPASKYGFTFRLPIIRDVPFDPGPGLPPQTQPKEDIDHLCSWTYGGESGYLYVQATPKSCLSGQGCVYQTVGAWLSFNDEAEAVTDAVYEYGGNHNNDFVTFPRGIKVLKFYHSTFGFGFRQCQPMDCIQAMAEDGVTVTEDGCTDARTLPIACVRIPMDGTLPDFPTTFEKCPSS